MHDRNLKILIEYDGTGFSGWQVQPARRTVQGELERAFTELAGEPVRVHGAGRTDSGVHALGQVAHVPTAIKLRPAEIAGAVNSRLPDDVLVKDAEDVPSEFNARFDAVSRSYFYLIGREKSPLWRDRRWRVSARLDLESMRKTLGPMRGEQDFSSFCLAGSEPAHHRCRVDAISLEWEPRFGGMLVFRVEANRFLRGMVRSIIGALVEVGRGKIAPDAMAGILEARDRGCAAATAPACGLYLERVTYTQEVGSEDIPGHR